MTVFVTGIAISIEFDKLHHAKLLETAEKVTSEDGTKILRVLLTDTTTSIKTEDAITTSFTNIIRETEGERDSYSGLQFKLYFEKVLRKIKRKQELKTLTYFLNRKQLQRRSGKEKRIFLKK